MTTTTFVPGTIITKEWLNDVNDTVYKFTQAGTGAVARTAQAKMRERVSVLDFGAKFDGITDDTAAILACYTYLQTLPYGGTMELPPGLGVCNNLVLTAKEQAPISIVGKGMVATQLVKSTLDSYPVITIYNAAPNTPIDSYINLQDFAIIGKNYLHVGLLLTLVARFTMNRVEIQGCSTALSLNGSLIAQLNDVNIIANTNGITSQRASIGGGNYCYCNLISINGGAFNNNGTTTTGAGYALNLGDANGIKVSGADIEGNGVSGNTNSGDILIQSTCGRESGVCYITFSGTWHENTLGQGLTAPDTSGYLNLKIENCQFLYGPAAGDINIGTARSLIIDNVVSSRITVGVTQYATYSHLNTTYLTESAQLSTYRNVWVHSGTNAARTGFQAVNTIAGNVAYMSIPYSGGTATIGGLHGVVIDSALLLPSGNNCVTKSPGFSEGLQIMGFGDTGSGDTHTFFQTNGGNYNAAIAGLKVGKATSNNRSINTGGTINVNGADYAEYETKANASDVFMAGEIVGFNANGKLTKKFSESISFGIKSTNPAFVGGDSWSPFLGKNDLTDAEKIEHDTARQMVDRIAYCGKVPVIYTGGKTGDYLVAVTSAGDSIGASFIESSAITIQLLQVSVGRVRNIKPDGTVIVAMGG